MKDLEKIKSEDLACQVADANPANFAIEQEVAQLVGATVPQPTEPSADDARELPAQLLVFLRRALLPIRSALRTAVADIYAHLDSRCTAYTPAGYASFQDPSTVPPYDPMRPLTPRTLPNLLQAITAFDGRKISNGSAPNDGIPDGTSLAHLICSVASADVTKLCDDNKGWTLTKNPLTYFPNLTKIQLDCVAMSEVTMTTSAEIEMNEVKSIYNSALAKGAFIYSGEKLSFPNLETIVGYPTNNSTGVFAVGSFKVLEIPKVTEIKDDTGYHGCFLGSYYDGGTPNLERIQFGKLTTFNWNFGGYYSTNYVSPCLDLIDVEIGAGTAINLNMSKWNPTNVLADADKTATFLQNFKEHIALRLTSNGSGKTLTLSQAVFSAVIEGSSPICDDIKGIIEDKGWKVQDTNNNIFPTT